jgi:hypothetical protein
MPSITILFEKESSNGNQLAWSLFQYSILKRNKKSTANFLKGHRFLQICFKIQGVFFFNNKDGRHFLIFLSLIVQLL